MASEKGVGRRRYGAEFKAQVVAECEAPGASVAKVAMAHGINANIVHGWRKLSVQARGTPRGESSADVRLIPAAFMPIALPIEPAISAAVADIRIDLEQCELAYIGGKRLRRLAA